MNIDYPIFDCDVLVVGGGSAGVMAGIRAKEVRPDQEVIVLEKGDAKYSGCIARGMGQRTRRPDHRAAHGAHRHPAGGVRSLVPLRRHGDRVSTR